MSLERFTWEAGDVVILTPEKDKAEIARKTKAWFQGFVVTKGGPTSGNFVHFGKAGQMGGSDPGGGHTNLIGGSALAKVARYRLARFQGKENNAVSFEQSDYHAASSWAEWAGRDWREGLKSHDVVAIKLYISDGDWANKPLRGKTSYETGTKHDIAVLEKAIDRAATSKDMIVFRNAGRTFEKKVAEAQPGQVIQDHGFCSTSLDGDIGTGGKSGVPKCKILLPRGTKGACLGPLAGVHSDEVEILLQRGTKLRYLGVEVKAAPAQASYRPSISEPKMIKYRIFEVIGDEQKPI